YHAAYPGDRERIEAIAAHLRDHDVRLPDGSLLPVRRFQAVGMALGGKMAGPQLHYLLEKAFVSGPDGPELRATFLHGLYQLVSHAGDPFAPVPPEPP